MSAKALFVRTFTENVSPTSHDNKRKSQTEVSKERTYSLCSQDNKAAKERKSSKADSSGDVKAIEDDLETILDITEQRPAFDVSGRRTYERACERVGVSPASQCMRGLQQSQTLDLQHYGLGPKSILPVAMALMINSAITSVNLEGNALGGEGVQYIQRMMEENSSILQLNLASNQLFSRGAESIALMLTTNKTINTLNLSRNGFVDGDALCLTKAMEDHPRLVDINLSHNRFGDQSSHCFSQLLAENGSLRHIDLSWNHFRGRGGAVLAKGLAENVSTKTLNLSWNGLGDEGTCALGQALTQNSVLQELDVTCNRASHRGFHDLMKALALNDTLQVLRVGRNNITDAGVEVVVEILKMIPVIHLKLLDLSDAILGSGTEARLEELKAIHPQLKVSYGYTDSYGQRKLASYDMVTEAIEILQDYCRKRGLRLVELFDKLDEDNSTTVTHAEFRKGLKEARLPLTTQHVDKLIKALDKDGDGEIDFSELAIGFKRKTTPIDGKS